jgi:hypothetical protein
MYKFSELPVAPKQANWNLSWLSLVSCAVYSLSRSSKKQQNESQCCCLSLTVALRWMTSSSKHASSQLSPPLHTSSGVWNSELCIYDCHTALRRDSWTSVRFYGAFAKLLKARISFFMSVCLPAWSNWAVNEIWYLKIFRKFVEKFQVELKSANSSSYCAARKDRCTVMVISNIILLRTKNVSDKSRRENQNTLFMFNNFLSEIRGHCEVMWCSRTAGRPQVL